MRWILPVFALVACSSSNSENDTPDPTSDTGSPADTAVASDTLAPPSDTFAAEDSAVVDAMPETDPGRDFSTDRSKFFGASRCAAAKVQLCEDFESGTLDTKTWTVVGTPPTIDGAEHARGSKALHVKRIGNGNSYIKESKTFPAMNNRYWGRVILRFASLPAPR